MSETPELSDLLETEDPGFKQVLSCVFGIQNHESRTYITLLDYPGSTVAELAEVLNRDRSNINRSLTTLMEKGLAQRERRLLDSGGYIYQYTGTELPDAKAMLHDALDEWAEQVHRSIDDYGGESA